MNFDEPIFSKSLKKTLFRQTILILKDKSPSKHNYIWWVPNYLELFLLLHKILLEILTTRIEDIYKQTRPCWPGVKFWVGGGLHCVFGIWPAFPKLNVKMERVWIQKKKIWRLIVSTPLRLVRKPFSYFYAYFFCILLAHCGQLEQFELCLKK